MLKIKRGKKALIALTLCIIMGTCAAAPAPYPGDYGKGPEDDFIGIPENKKEEQKQDSAGVPAENGEEQKEGAAGLTIQKEPATETLYLEALNATTSGTQKYTTVRRGDFVMETTVAASVIYPKQERIRYDFPYGETYYLEALGLETQNKSAGDAIVSVYVAMDEIQLAAMERQLQRMEERGETGTAYEEAQKQLAEMQKALTTTEIVMEKDGILIEQEILRFGTKISSYTIVVADPKERLLEVPNENKLFRFGQKVKVSAKVNGVTCTGTGTVITASASMVSEELAGTTAYIRLDEESEYLYDGSGFSVKVETVHMEDVLLMDLAASYMSNGMQMVKVKDEYGLHAAGFTFGRKNAATYWVIDGLEEGTQILLQK